MNLNTELPDDIAQAIADYIQDQPTPTDIPSVLQTALQTFLTERGYLGSQKPFAHYSCRSGQRSQRYLN